jgi:hypothetical protein
MELNWKTRHDNNKRNFLNLIILVVYTKKTLAVHNRQVRAVFRTRMLTAIEYVIC